MEEKQMKMNWRILDLFILDLTRHHDLQISEQSFYKDEISDHFRFETIIWPLNETCKNAFSSCNSDLLNRTFLQLKFRLAILQSNLLTDSFISFFLLSFLGLLLISQNWNRPATWNKKAHLEIFISHHSVSIWQEKSGQLDFLKKKYF